MSLHLSKPVTVMTP